MMIRLLAFVLVCVLGVGPAAGQSGERADERAIRAQIEALFDGMRAGDSTAVRAVFHEQARLHTALGPSDSSTARATPVDEFVEAVGRPHEKVWDERFWNVEIRVDGPLASAWVPYVFYHGDELSHCGVDAMQFVRTPAGWQILQITDTRRQECDVPPDVRK